MIPFRTLAETHTADGSRFSLHEHDGQFFLKLNGRQLMGSNNTVSERQLADIACDFRKPREGTSILIGGLGLGFSLRRVLDICGPKAVVEVAELLPEVVDWNRQFLAELNGGVLDDARVRVFCGDVFDSIRRAPAQFDSILLDVDNGPGSYVQAANARIYSKDGLALLLRSLRPGGRVAFWSAGAEPGFLPRLSRAGFAATEFEAKAHERAKRAAHRIYLGERMRPEESLSGCPPAEPFQGKRGRRAGLRHR